MKPGDKLEGLVAESLGRPPTEAEKNHAIFRFMIALDDAKEKGIGDEKAKQIALRHGVLSVRA